MNELIKIAADEQGSLTVSSLAFAAGLDVQHKNLLETIRTHQAVIERDFGLIAFETRKIEGGKGRPETVAHLTEDQALFVGTLSRNSKRVVEFKSVLVKSFAEARKRLLTPAVSTEQVLIQLMTQQTQLLADNQQMIAQLRADVDQIMHGQRPSRRQIPGKQLQLPGVQPTRIMRGNLRQLVNRLITEYCELNGYLQGDTYKYLYSRMFDVYGTNVHRLKRIGNESIIDAIERYGHLDQLYCLVTSELNYRE